jgi:protease secretion system outer membrane protein
MRATLLAAILALAALPVQAAEVGARAGSGAAASVDAAAGEYDLASAWRAALRNDPAYQAAISEREAGQTNRAMGRAGLLPQVSASLGRTRIDGTLDSPTPTGSVVTEDLDYMAKTNELRASQPVFNWGRIAEYRQGHARADYSLAVFDTRAKDTSVRLVNRYFQTLLAYENVVLARNNLDANEKHIEVAQRRYDSGEGTVTDVRETRSRRDLSRAELIQRQDALVVARRELQEMVGASPVRLVALTPKFTPRPLNPPALADWMAMAMKANAEIRTGEEGVRVAELEVDRNFGGHLPSVDLVASRRVVERETISTRNQDSATTSVGVQVNLPIFSGGLTSAQVDQARHNRDRASSELSATRERIAVEVTRQYQGVVSGTERIRALEVAVKSTADALVAVERGYQAGTRSVVDILDAQEQLYRSQLDLTQARLEYVLARLMLSAAAGGLDSGVIDDVSENYFKSQPVDVLQASLPVQRQGDRSAPRLATATR